MRSCVTVLALAIVARGVSAQTRSPAVIGPSPESASIRLTPDNARFSRYLEELASPRAAVGIVGGSVLERLRHEDRTDLSTEIASRVSRRVADVTVRHGLAAAMHLSTDDHYQFCECRGLGPRVGHALVQTFTDSRGDGSRALAIPRIAGSTVAGFTGLAWEHDRSVGSVLTGTALSFGLHALFNIGRELTGLGR